MDREVSGHREEPGYTCYLPLLPSTVRFRVGSQFRSDRVLPVTSTRVTGGGPTVCPGCSGSPDRGPGPPHPSVRVLRWNRRDSCSETPLSRVVPVPEVSHPGRVMGGGRFDSSHPTYQWSLPLRHCQDGSGTFCTDRDPLSVHDPDYWS